MTKKKKEKPKETVASKFLKKFAANVARGTKRRVRRK